MYPTGSGTGNMENFFRKIKLSSDFSLTLPINGNELANKLAKVTILETTLFETIGNSDKIFVGTNNLTELSLRPKKQFGQNNLIYSTRLTAKLGSTPTSVTINGVIQLTKFYPIVMLSSLLLFFIVAFITIVQANAVAGIIVCFQVAIMFSVFYFIFRNAIKKSKNFFEKELYFLTNNSH
jgi:hypothetical protein